jgi:hypothetical protein
MKKNVPFKIGLIAIGIAAAMSCSKKNNDSPQQNIVGTWKVTSEGIDTNHNNVLDQNEIISSDTSWAHHILTFKSDGTLTETYYSVIKKYTYEWVGNNTYLKTTFLDTSYHGGPSSLKITTISNTTLTLMDTTTNSPDWVIFTKQ